MVGIILIIGQLFAYSSGSRDIEKLANFCGQKAARSSISIRNILPSEQDYEVSLGLRLVNETYFAAREATSYATQMIRLQSYDPEQILADAQFEEIVSELEHQNERFKDVEDQDQKELRTTCMVKCFTAHWIKYDHKLADKLDRYHFDRDAFLKKVKSDFAYRASNILFERKAICTQYSISASKLLFRLGISASIVANKLHTFNSLRSQSLYFEPQNSQCEFMNH